MLAAISGSGTFSSVEAVTPVFALHHPAPTVGVGSFHTGAQVPAAPTRTAFGQQLRRISSRTASSNWE